jgi:hypothetical protein
LKWILAIESQGVLLESTILAGYGVAALFPGRDKGPVDIVADLVEVALENTDLVGIVVAGVGLVSVPYVGQIGAGTLVTEGCLVGRTSEENTE